MLVLHGRRDIILSCCQTNFKKKKPTYWLTYNKNLQELPNSSDIRHNLQQFKNTSCLES